jgi:hypothetical protein
MYLDSLVNTMFRDFMDIYPNHYQSRGYTYTDDGEKRIYYKNGKVHNHKGPAVEYYAGEHKGKVEFWLEGKQVDKEAVDKLAEEKENNRKVRVIVDDKSYVITGKQLKELDLHAKLEAL